MPSTTQENAAEGNSAAAPTSGGKTVKQWLAELEKRQRQFERQWYKDAKHAIEVYETKDEHLVPFNILFSNIETLVPALYNSTPRPDVARRFGMDAGTPEAAANHAAAEISNRFLEYISDTNSCEYEDFSGVTQTAVFSGLLTGFGTARVQRDTEVCFEQVAFDRFLWGFARTWKQVPWVAYGHDMSRVGFEAQFPEVKAAQWYKDYKWPEVSEDARNETPGSQQAISGDRAGTMLVWEIWDWERKQITFVCKACPDLPLVQDAYPFQLTSRFPSPEPIRLVKRLLNLEPLVPYNSYKKEAEQLQLVTKRLNNVIKACIVRGVYNPQLAEFEKVLGDDTDNKLIAAENAAAFIEGKGLEANVWFMPIDKLIQAAQQMTLAQTQIKNTIYEIMGIADVMRGAGAASETLGAQQIKNQWGTLRMKRAQRDIQVFCRDLFRVALEFGVNTMSPQELKEVTGVQYPLAVQKQQALAGQQAYQQAQAQGQQLPPPTPAQIALTLLPTVEDACAVLTDNFQRQYRIDIETNSTIDLEASEDQKNIGDFMNAFGQMMAGLSPLVENGTMQFSVAKVIMIEVCRRFKFGRDVEDALEMMQAPSGAQGAAAQKSALDAAVKQVQDLADLRLQQVQADCSTKISKVEEQLVLMVGELQVAKVQLAQATLDKAKVEIKAATQGQADTQEAQAAMAATSQAAQQTKLQATGQVIAAGQQVHAERTAHAMTKVAAQHAAQNAKNKESELRARNLQKAAAGPKV